jgi:hypothetical protein
MNEETDTFEIEFDTKKYPGKIEATQISLSVIIMKHTDMANLALCEHPLYERLWHYCKRNPPRVK